MTWVVFVCSVFLDHKIPHESQKMISHMLDQLSLESHLWVCDYSVPSSRVHFSFCLLKVTRRSVFFTILIIPLLDCNYYQCYYYASFRAAHTDSSYYIILQKNSDQNNKSPNCRLKYHPTFIDYCYVKFLNLYRSVCLLFFQTFPFKTVVRLYATITFFLFKSLY